MTALVVLLGSYVLVFAAGYSVRSYISNIRRDRYGVRGRDHSTPGENWA
jgi:hypothetical protein